MYNRNIESAITHLNRQEGCRKCPYVPNNVTVWGKKTVQRSTRARSEQVALYERSPVDIPCI